MWTDGDRIVAALARNQRTPLWRILQILGTEIGRHSSLTWGRALVSAGNKIARAEVDAMAMQYNFSNTKGGPPLEYTDAQLRAPGMTLEGTHYQIIDLPTEYEKP